MSKGAAHPFDVRGETVSERFCGDPKKWPFGSLKPFSYELIMIDPPWPTQMRSPKGEKQKPCGITAR
jgi:endonuclease YncB( thermonuclease family)